MGEEREAALRRAREMQDLLERVEADNARMDGLLRELGEARARMRRLADYYYGRTWLEDVDRLAGEGAVDLPVLGQDPVYNADTDHDQHMRRLLVFVTEHLARSLREPGEPGDETDGA